MPATEIDKIITKYAKYNIGEFSQETIRIHVLFTKQLFKYLDKPIFEVTPEDINRWIEWLFINNYSKAGIRKRVWAILAFFNWCIIKKFLFDNPCADIPRFKSLNKKYLTERIE